MKTVLCLVMTLFLSANICAAEKIPLFKDYYYGMSRAEIAAGGAAPCNEVLDEDDENLANALCMRNEIKFLKQDWIEMFFFEGDKLDRVALIKDFTPEAYTAAVGGMINNSFMPVLMMQGDDNIDVVRTIKELGQQKASEVISDFEQKALAGASEYSAIFLPLDFVRNNNSKGAFQMLRSAPEDLRCVTVTKNDEALALSFEALGKTLKNLHNILEESKESF